MNNPWENCGKGYEWATLKEYHGEWTHKQFCDWLNNNCEKCPYYSGYHCAYGDIEINDNKT